MVKTNSSIEPIPLAFIQTEVALKTSNLLPHKIKTIKRSDVGHIWAKQTKWIWATFACRVTVAQEKRNHVKNLRNTFKKTKLTFLSLL